MFIADGWGARLKEERERIGLTQQAFTHRNTQRAYEQEASCPDLRYIADVERGGLDARYILTGERVDELGDSAMANVLRRLWPNLGAEHYAALTTLASALDDARATGNGG